MIVNRAALYMDTQIFMWQNLAVQLGYVEVLFFIFIYVLTTCYVCVPHVCSALGGQKRALDLLELELQAAIWVLGTETSPLEEQPVP